MSAEEYAEIFRIERNLRVVAEMLHAAVPNKSKLKEILKALGKVAGDLEEVIPEDVYTELRIGRTNEIIRRMNSGELKLEELK